jgi:hypothetical protein
MNTGPPTADTGPVTHDALRRRQETVLHRLPHLEPNELLAATRALLAADERVCPDYCRKAGIAYPAEEVLALRRVLGEFDRLR